MSSKVNTLSDGTHGRNTKVLSREAHETVNQVSPTHRLHRCYLSPSMLTHTCIASQACCASAPMQVRHVKTGGFTADLAVNNIRTEMCRRMTRLVRDLYIRRPVLLAEVGEPKGWDCTKGDDVSALLVGTYKFPR